MSAKANRTTGRTASRGRGLRLLMATTVMALVLPMAACQKETGGAIDPEKLALKDAISAAGSANMDVQSVSIIMPTPSLDTQASNDAMIAATSSYAYAVILFDELIQAGESGDYSTFDLEAMLAQVRLAYQEAEVQVQVAAVALQEELGSNWRDLDLLEPIDLEDDSWATAALDPSTPDPMALGDAAPVEPAAFSADEDDDNWWEDSDNNGWGEDGSWEGGWGDDDQWGGDWGDSGSGGGASWEDDVIDKVLLEDPRKQDGPHLGSLATTIHTDIQEAEPVLDAAEDAIEEGSGFWGTVRALAQSAVRVGVKGFGMFLTGTGLAMAAPAAGTATGPWC